MKVEVRFDAVELHEATFGKAPECFDAVDVSFAFDQGSGFLDADMFVITHIHQSIIADPLVSVQYTGRIAAISAQTIGEATVGLLVPVAVRTPVGWFDGSPKIHRIGLSW